MGGGLEHCQRREGAGHFIFCALAVAYSALCRRPAKRLLCRSSRWGSWSCPGVLLSTLARCFRAVAVVPRVSIGWHCQCFRDCCWYCWSVIDPAPVASGTRTGEALASGRSGRPPSLTGATRTEAAGLYCRGISLGRCPEAGSR
uniref:(northern house mosquito) hypothetical protein n=1 Tax=Culex pipiens TaxID=7175 RepID=A0A8D8PET3_CULPI